MSKQVVTNQAWCKGCGICVAFCPKQVLTLKDGKIDVTYPERCIKCGLCEMRCPDYAIFLEEIQAPPADIKDQQDPREETSNGK